MCNFRRYLVVLTSISLKISYVSPSGGVVHPYPYRGMAFPFGQQRQALSHPVSAPVIETDDPFLALWPHRFDYLFAQHPDPGQSPEWRTESRHPLSDRLIIQGSTLYGVRFEADTSYGLLDIDAGSPYHPRRDPFAVQRLCEALEPLGLVEHLIVTSSDSGGLHVYFPFEEALPSWRLAIAMTVLLENAGFKIIPGWLEVFPNPKPFSSDGSISLYNGHRLPLQRGSYLLNSDLQPTPGSRQTFARQWNCAAQRNAIDAGTLARTIKQYKRKTYRISGKAEKFLNDLNAEIEAGWTGRGQTNHLLGRIAMRSYIFAHTLYAAVALTGEALAKDIVRVATALPGYDIYCNHRHEIDKKARDWARSVENSHYFPYGKNKPGTNQDADDAQLSWNQLGWNDQQRIAARQRIQDAVVSLFREERWPEGITDRFERLCRLGLSGSTLYKHRDLWHPRFMVATASPETDGFFPIPSPVENPPNPPSSKPRVLRSRAWGADLTPSGPNLLGAIDCNPSASKGLSQSVTKNISVPDRGVRNTDLAAVAPSEEGSDRTDDQATDSVFTAPPRQLLHNIKQMLLGRQQNAQLPEEKAAQWAQHQQEQREARRRAHIQQLRQWLDSGDPLLMAEAQQQLQRLGLE